MLYSRILLKPVTVIYLFRLSVVLGHYDGTVCCNLALKEGAFRKTSTPPEAYVCGQKYDISIPPAPELLINYTYCSHHCPGFGLSHGQTTSEWAAPLVQFILPSVIFSMVVPRQQKIELGTRLRIDDWAKKRLQWIYYPIMLPLSMFVSFVLRPLVAIIDNAIWIVMIFVGAGSMLIGGLHEALLDYRIVHYIRAEPTITARHKVELLLTLVSGNLMRDIGNPQAEIYDNLATSVDATERDEQISTRLLSMMWSQPSFGSTIGAPVLFYLGAFVYTILDLLAVRSNQDAAISLAFGVEWMVIVHVAIISGCLLASNNPSTSTAIVGLAPDDTTPLPYRAPTIPRRVGASQSIFSRVKLRLGFSRTEKRIRKLPAFAHVYETRFQPVWLWSRGRNKMAWIENTDAFRQNSSVKKRMKVSILDWLLFIILPTLVLIVVPPLAGAAVAYGTPPVGFGCRSLSFVCYAGAQVILMAMFLLRQGSEVSKTWENHPRLRKAVGRTANCITVIALFVSIFTAIGGTWMQIMGVYRNCFCYVNSQYWLNLDSSPGISVATDTEQQRESSLNWIIMGSVATGFMAITTYFGWWYQRLIQTKFAEGIESISNLRADPVDPVFNANNSDDQTPDYQPSDPLLSHNGESPGNNARNWSFYPTSSDSTNIPSRKAYTWSHS